MKEIVSEAFIGLGLMYLIAVIMMFAVIFAMCIDFVSGWRKAKERGEEHTSYAFSRSLTKFLIYEGIALISTCIDTIIHFVWAQFADKGSYYFVPVVTAFACIILCVVEWWSVKEKANQKQRRRMTEAADLVVSILKDETIKQTFVDTITDRMQREKESEFRERDYENYRRAD